MNKIGPRELAESRHYAASLEAALTPERQQELRDRAARMFFDEEGIPAHLQEGWAALEERRKIRKQVAYPLPPGGCFLLGNEQVVAGCLAEMHTALAKMLQLEASDIKLRLERTEGGGLTPVADVDLPDDWLLPIAKDPHEDPKAAAKRYLGQCLETASSFFRRAVSERLEANGLTKKHLLQAVLEPKQNG